MHKNKKINSDWILTNNLREKRSIQLLKHLKLFFYALHSSLTGEIPERSINGFHLQNDLWPKRPSPKAVLCTACFDLAYSYCLCYKSITLQTDRHPQLSKQISPLRELCLYLWISKRNFCILPFQNVFKWINQKLCYVIIIFYFWSFYLFYLDLDEDLFYLIIGWSILKYFIKLILWPTGISHFINFRYFHRKSQI